MRTAWRALLGADILRKVLLKTRPYEIHKGETDRVHAECLKDLCLVVERPGISHKLRLSLMVESLTRSRDRFRAIPARYDRDVPLIGLVGEIFCRLNRFSNSELIRKVEELGGECWQSDVSEWVWYTNVEQKLNLVQQGKRISLAMAGALIKHHIQHRDEHALLKPFHEDFAGYEEPTVAQVLKNGEPYLPHGKVLGEMVLSMGKSIYYWSKGADGIIDISPFTCMNGIVSEAVYPRLSRDYDHIPIRNFFFDGTYQDLDRDVGIFLELARTYKKKKRPTRKYPWYFPGSPVREKTA
jgi:predicted nucleotide-binding protein (sugar kinase/HSP70/actin superfamily)